jgi:hypothetical protein
MVSPYISFVAVARNDNYGGDFLSRINLFVKSIIVLSERYALPTEILIVEWNPPADRPRLKDAVSWPSVPRRYCRVRIVEVSPELHSRLANPKGLSLFEYIGKNVGIRRADAPFILVTNPDILFSEQIIEFFSRQKLSTDSFYRAARTDIGGTIPPDKPLEEQLAFCAENVLIYQRYIFRCENRACQKYNPYKWARSLAIYLKQTIKFYPFKSPFTNASGDFLLMHRSNWATLRGYAEFPDRGHRLDGVMVLNALFAGSRQVVLPNRLAIYHHQHDRPESGAPWSEAVKEAYDRLMRGRKPILFNSESWGLVDEAMVEYVV